MKEVFFRNLTSDDRQRAGYELEDLLGELFAAFEMEYRKPYRTATQQIDGSFRLDGFDYIVEAKWRKDLPDEQEIAGFRNKVETKLESTRGMFVAVQGFRDEVVRQFSGRGANIIFVCGYDLTMILEGRWALPDALRLKVTKAAQEGVVYYPLPF